MKLEGKLTEFRSIAFRAITLTLLFQLFVVSGTITNGQEIANQSHIAQLIEQLSSNDFGARELAFEKLEDLGLEPFDQLYEVSRSDIPSQRLAATRLLKLTEHKWIDDIECEFVQPILSHYFKSQNTNIRKGCLHKIAELPSDSAIITLIQVCRYESETLSRIAARRVLKLLGNRPSKTSPGRKELPSLIREHLSNSSRIASQWLLAAVSATPNDPVWLALCQRELEYLQESPNLNPCEYQARLDLVQWYLNECFRSGQKLDHPAIESQYVQLVAKRELIGTLIWLERNNRFHSIDQLKLRHQEFVDSSPVALHVIAKSKFNSGQFDEVDRLLRQSDQAMGNHAAHFLQLGVTLQHIGFDQLAERALTQAIDRAQTGSGEYCQAYLALANQSQRQMDFQTAHLQLNDVYNRIKDNEAAQKSLMRHCGVTPRQINARAKYSLAMHLRMQGKWESSLELLLDATELDPNHSGILIALNYHANDDDPEFAKQIVAWVGSRIDELELQILEIQNELDNTESSRKVAALKSSLALHLNRVAWLRVNTGNDLARAERSALRACELCPKVSAYLDTLARCQYGKGKVQLAISSQHSAMLISPGNARYRQQLDNYQNALRRSAMANLRMPMIR